MSVTMQFATMLRNSRCKAQITQREAAELCGISLRHYQNLEMGFTNPKLSNWLKLPQRRVDVPVGTVENLNHGRPPVRPSHSVPWPSRW